MNQHLQKILNTINDDKNLSEEEKNAIIKSLKDADKEIEIVNFKLDRTEKVKRTTAILLEETIEELEQKRKAVEAQNKELEIESSLERVRTVAMGMIKREDMLAICRIISEQLELLQVQDIRNVQTAIIDEAKHIYLNYEYYRKHDKTFITEVDYTRHPVQSAFALQMLRGKGSFFSTSLEGEKLDEFIEHQKAGPEFVDPFLLGSVSLNWYWASLGPIAFGISTYSPLNEESQAIVKRFRNVFDLSYRRYLDIEKAEAQAREAQIELALERIRARTMAMQKSEELLETSLELFQQLKELGEPAEQFTIGVIKEEENIVEVSVTLKGSKLLQTYRHDINEPYVMNKMFKAWKAKEKTLVIEQQWEELREYNKIRNKLVQSDMFPVDLKPGDQRLLYVAFYSKGTLALSSNEPRPKETLELLERFAKVFDQTYTRFLDLQKAEGQSKESQIQLALERARSQSMIMQHSTELDDTLRVFHEQILLLNIPSAFSFLWLPDEKNNRHIFWAAWREEKNGSADFKSKAINYPLDRNEPATAQCLIDWKGTEPIVSYQVLPAGVENYFAAWQELIAGVEQLKAKYFSGGLYYVEAFMKYGCFGVMVTNDLMENEKQVLGRFAIEFERTYRRFLDLQKAESQAKEAQIEAALEKVRSRSLAMHQSGELEDVIMVVSEQLLQLQFRFHNVSFSSTNEQRETTFWLATPGRPHPYLIHLPYINTTMLNRVFEARENGVEFLADIITAEQNQEWLQHLVYKSRHSFSEEDKKYLLTLKGLARSTVLTKHIILAIINYAIVPYTEEQNAILKRFGNVFEQAYTRFLDLQKAEGQAREAQIETSLERVRSRSMAMHSSNELKEVITVVMEQFKQLGFCIDLANFNINSTKDWSMWLATPDYTYPEIIHIPYIKHPLFDSPFKALKNGSDFFSDILTEEEKNTVVRHLYANSILGQFDSEERKQYVFAGKGFARSVVFMKHIILTISNYSAIPYTDEQNTILKRFGNVFEQAYTRFLDLQKAEAQARESKIEASLERVRSKAMSMHKSDDLHAAVAVVFEELDKLDVGVLRVGISVLNKEKRCGNVWLTSIDEGKAVQVSGDEPFDIHPLLQGAFEAWLRQEDFYYVLEGDDLKQYYQAVEKAEFRLPASQMFVTEAGPSQQHCFVAVYNSGGLFAFSETAFPEESKTVMRRFAAVFDLTYKRFLDLQKAEAQANEARIEVALERVRSRTLAMQRSDELAETAAVLFQQLIALGIEPNRLYISIVKNDQGDSEFWITDEDGSKVSTAYSANLNDNPTFSKMYAGWKQQLKTQVIDMQGEELQSYFRHLTSIGVPFKGGLTQKRRVQDIAYFNKGFIGMASPDEQPAETLQLLERFAAVFNLTFTRFNDLKIAEAHALQAEQDLVAIKEAKQKAEETLSELQATQKQLIQSEKMASLGELTAGIAHEIQNPLNFVNNFSEVSNELMDEMNAEIEKGDMVEARAIANDIKQNLEKINHHGKRADAIVKGMLQHSRATSATKEPTDINKLADEYLRLAYHGLRAKDKSFNATLRTDYDETIGNINIIPQDIGRVVLNLITNAFYVVNEKTLSAVATSTAVKYEPTVSISTKKVNNKVEIKVTDNGNGIPKDILDKIFQPFFTTKPTGQGTGLGLSLSYDIVKAHGGELKVETLSAEAAAQAGKESAGSTFIIQLPIS